MDKARSPSLAMLLEVARDCGVLLVGGSIPEARGGKFYNTCVVVRPNGRVAALHRKVHLFDIHVPGGISFRESDTLSAGDSLTLVDTSWGFSLGLGICYDIRFPEMAMVLRARGAKLLLFPGAFNLTTGPAHWELLQRARAVDNQVTGNGRGKGRAGVRLREASDREMPPATDWVLSSPVPPSPSLSSSWPPSPLRGTPPPPTKPGAIPPSSTPGAR